MTEQAVPIPQPWDGFPRHLEIDADGVFVWKIDLPSYFNLNPVERALPITWDMLEEATDELKQLAETPAEKEARRMFYEGHEQQLATTEPKGPVIRTTYGMVEIASDPVYHHPTVEDYAAYFEWAKWNQTGDGHGNYFTPTFDDWMQMMYPANYRHGRELQ